MEAPGARGRERRGRLRRGRPRTARSQPGRCTTERSSRCWGANGAGKSTLLRALSGLLTSTRARSRKGSGDAGRRVDRAGSSPAHRERGVAHVLEGRRIFKELTVEENLKVRGHTAASQTWRENLERVYDLFPVLRARRGSKAGYLSGGEQQMLAIGRALMADPQLLLFDEPSLGLAPMLVASDPRHHRRDQRAGDRVLLVEQNATMALSIATTAT